MCRNVVINFTPHFVGREYSNLGYGEFVLYRHTELDYAVSNTIIRESDYNQLYTTF